jgi:hypothetical protein
MFPQATTGSFESPQDTRREMVGPVKETDTVGQAVQLKGSGSTVGAAKLPIQVISQVTLEGNAARYGQAFLKCRDRLLPFLPLHLSLPSGQCGTCLVDALAEVACRAESDGAGRRQDR